MQGLCVYMYMYVVLCVLYCMCAAILSQAAVHTFTRPVSEEPLVRGVTLN